MLAAEVNWFLRDRPDMIDDYDFNNFVTGLCEVLRSDNPRFDKEKFLEACYRD